MSGPVDVRKDLNSIASLLEQLRQNNAAIMLDRVSAAVAELIEAHRNSVAELVRIRDAAMVVCCAVESGTNVAKHADALLSELDKPWSVDRSRAALANVGSAS